MTKSVFLRFRHRRGDLYRLRNVSAVVPFGCLSTSATSVFFFERTLLHEFLMCANEKSDNASGAKREPTKRANVKRVTIKYAKSKAHSMSAWCFLWRSHVFSIRRSVDGSDHNDDDNNGHRRGRCRKIRARERRNIFVSVSRLFQDAFVAVENDARINE